MGWPACGKRWSGRAKPRWPRRSHHDAGIGLTWELKDTLPARRDVYYGKLLKGRPVLVALDLFPAFYALVRGPPAGARLSRRVRGGPALAHREAHHGRAHARGAAVHARPARGVLHARAGARRGSSSARWPSSSRGSGWSRPRSATSRRFSYRWDLVERWLPEAVAEGRRLSRAAALRRARRSRYLRGARYTTPRRVARLLRRARRRRPRPRWRRSLASGAARADEAVAGWPGRWVVSAR